MHKGTITAIKKRTQAGLTAARARGRFGGRPKVLDQKKAHMAQALYNDKRNSIADICKTLRVSRATLYRYIKVPPQEKDGKPRLFRGGM